MLAIMSPAVVFVAFVGGAGLRGRLRLLGTVAAAVAGTLVVGSAALAYHDTRLAPIDRMTALADVGDRFAGRGPMLFNEYEEFAKYFMRHARINASTDAVTPVPIKLRGGNGYQFQTYDLDEQRLDYVEQFPYIVVRRGPATSRPPSNYRLDYSNAFYAVWQRVGGSDVRDHLPLGTPTNRSSAASCAAIRAFARAAQPGQQLIAAAAPTSSTWSVVSARARPLWPLDDQRPGLLLMATPGIARGKTRVSASGRFEVWVQGSFARPLAVSLDGRHVGDVQGTDTPGGWLQAGTVRLAAGQHDIQIRRPGGGLAPGDGARSSIGAVTLIRPGDERLVRLTPRAAPRLCGRSWDWIERVVASE
jgi:hypothetical protein